MYFRSVCDLRLTGKVLVVGKTTLYNHIHYQGIKGDKAKLHLVTFSLHFCIDFSHIGYIWIVELNSVDIY